MTPPRVAGFRVGVYVFKDAEVVDFAAPYGVLSVARRFDPEIDACLIWDAARPVQAQAGFTVLPNYSFQDNPAIDAFLIPGGSGTRQEMQEEQERRRTGATIDLLFSPLLLNSCDLLDLGLVLRRALLDSERFHRMDAGRAPRRDPARERDRRDDDERHGDISRSVQRRDTEEQRRHQPCKNR